VTDDSAPLALVHQMASEDAAEWVHWSPSAMQGTAPQCLAWTATEHIIYITHYMSLTDN